MPARVEKMFEVGLPFDQTVKMVKEILPYMDATIRQSDEQKGTFEATKDPNGNFGAETINVEIEQVQDKGCRIRVISKSTSDTTVPALGANDENIAVFQWRLSRYPAMPQPAAQPAVSDPSSLVAPQTAQAAPPAPAPVQPSNPSPYAYASRPTKDRSLALILEIVLGMFGFLGIGWLYSGKTDKGILWLVGMFAWDLVAAVVIIATAGFGCICTLPVSIGLIAISASTLSGYTKQHPEVFNP